MTTFTALTSIGSGLHLPTHGTDGASHHAITVTAVDYSTAVRPENGTSCDANTALNSRIMNSPGVSALNTRLRRKPKCFV